MGATVSATQPIQFGKQEALFNLTNRVEVRKNKSSSSAAQSLSTLEATVRNEPSNLEPVMDPNV